MQQQNPNQPMGFGYGFPPNWGFPGQFPGPFLVNQWINPQGSWAGGGSSQQQFPGVQQVQQFSQQPIPFVQVQTPQVAQHGGLQL
jgi:hypothetical protein